MEMKRIEADTLEEAYSKAAKELSCSVTEINYEIIQHPTSGVMGLFKKTAIISAVKKITDIKEEPKQESVQKPIEDSTPLIEEEKEEEVIQTKVEKQPIVHHKEKSVEEFINKDDDIVDNFFSDEVKDDSEELIFDDDRYTPENKRLSIDIENKISKMMEVACFHIDTVEVDVFNGIAHIFLDGEDAALLIGKEGYRYNALSYMLFNWINAEYNRYIKLEISEFIQAQEEMIDNYLKPIAEHILEHGRGKTKPLDGILVQIALEKLRAMFPNKYIAIKTGKDGKKFIVINDFNSKKK